MPRKQSPLVCIQISGRHIMLTVAFHEFVVLRLIFEQRLQTLHFKFHLDAVLQFFTERFQGCVNFFFRIHGRADRREQMGMFRRDNGVACELQRCG